MTDQPTPPKNPTHGVPLADKANPQAFLQQAAAQRPRGPTFKFTIPQKMQLGNSLNPSFVHLRELRVEDQLAAMRVAQNDRNRMPDELTKASLCMVDGREVNHAISEADTLWAKWSPKVRQLLTQAYLKIHVPSDEEEASFFASMTQEV